MGFICSAGCARNNKAPVQNEMIVLELPCLREVAAGVR